MGKSKVKVAIEDMIGKTYGTYKVLRFIGAKEKTYILRGQQRIHKLYMLRIQCIHCGKKYTKAKLMVLYQNSQCKCRGRKEYVKIEHRVKDNRNSIIYNMYSIQIILDNWELLLKYRENKEHKDCQSRRLTIKRFPDLDVIVLPYSTLIPHRITEKLLTADFKNKFTKELEGQFNGYSSFEEYHKYLLREII